MPSFLTARELLVMYRAIDEPKKQPELVSAGERKQLDMGQHLVHLSLGSALTIENH